MASVLRRALSLAHRPPPVMLRHKSTDAAVTKVDKTTLTDVLVACYYDSGRFRTYIRAGTAWLAFYVGAKTYIDIAPLSSDDDTYFTTTEVAWRIAHHTGVGMALLAVWPVHALCWSVATLINLNYFRWTLPARLNDAESAESKKTNDDQRAREELYDLRLAHADREASLRAAEKAVAVDRSLASQVVAQVNYEASLSAAEKAVIVDRVRVNEELEQARIKVSDALVQAKREASRRASLNQALTNLEEADAILSLVVKSVSDRVPAAEVLNHAEAVKSVLDGGDQRR